MEDPQYGNIAVSFQMHLDGGGPRSGQRLGHLFKALGMPKQQRVFERRAGPGFMGFSMFAQGMCETLRLATSIPRP